MDVNKLATEVAERLGGIAEQLRYRADEAEYMASIARELRLQVRDVVKEKNMACEELKELRKETDSDRLRHTVQLLLGQVVRAEMERDQWRTACIKKWTEGDGYEYEKDSLFMMLAQKAQERDAAVKEIPRVCGTCGHYHEEEPHCEQECLLISGVRTGWEWRGPCEQNGGTS